MFSEFGGRVSAPANWGWGLVISALFHVFLLSLFRASGPVDGEALHGTRFLDIRLASQPLAFDSAPPVGANPLSTVSANSGSLSTESGKPAGRGGSLTVPPKRDDRFDDYLARPYLTASPQSMSLVSIESPDVGGRSPEVLRLTLFIDEHGVVRRVRVDTPDFLHEYVEAASQAFLSARFRPGEVSGQPVKAQLQVEVVFNQ